MPNNRGKLFENKFKEDWKKSFPDSFILRLPDQTTHYSGSTNPCDFIAYTNGNLYLMECKSHKGNTLPLSAIPQYKRLLNFKNLTGVYPGLVIWFLEKDKVCWIGIGDLEKLVEDGNKSINVKMIDKGLYNIIEIPSIKKRVFMDSDYKILINKEIINGKLQD